MRPMPSCSNCGLTIEPQVRFCPDCGTKVVSQAPDEDPLLGRTLNEKYRVLERVGSGSMGTVYRAEHIALKKKVALKVLRPDLHVTEETLQRFQREGIAAGRFSHPNAIQIFDFDREDRLFYLAMEFVEGRNITELLSDEGRLSVESAIDIVRQTLAALAEAHDHGIIHRDLKPENIMVIRRAGGGYSVKVLDFGLSKLIGLPLAASLATQMGRVMGTPLYMAPEQGSGEDVDHRSDLYAVGLILYELLSGRPPFQADTFMELVQMQASVSAPLLSEKRPELGIPPPLDDVIQKALAKDRAARFQSADEMLRALDSYESAAPLRTSRSAEISRPERRGQPSSAAGSGRRLRLVLGAVVLGLVGSLGGVWAWSALGVADSGEDLPRVSMKSADRRSPAEAEYVSLLEQARASLALGEVDDAMVQVQDALRRQVHDSEAFYVRGLVYRARQDDDTALVDLREALDMDPDYAEAAAAIGWIHVDRGELREASARFAAVEGMGSSSPEGLIGQGAVSYLEGDPARAKELLTQALQQDEDNARGQYYLGRALLDGGEIGAARDSFILAKRSDPDLALAFVGLGETYLAEDRREEAEVQFREALRLDPDRFEPVLHLALLLLDAERIEEALTLLSESLQRHPDWSRLHVLRGIALSRRGEDEEAIAALESGLQDPDADLRARILLGILLQRSGRPQDALEQYRRVIAIDERLALPHLNEGLVLFAQDRIDEAAASLERAVAADPENAFAHYTLGVLYMDYIPDAQKALLHLEAYEELDGRDPRVEGWIGDLIGR
jgi:serine/threonine protein kinase/Flp pilus assembly protein TadD